MGDTDIKGPRPISLHFANSQNIWDQAAKAGVASLDVDIWNEQLRDRVEALTAKLETSIDPAAVNDAIVSKAGARKADFIAGINSYIARPYKRHTSDTVIAKKTGCVTLHDYGGNGQPVLMVPSLVNPYYILDLMPGRSFVGYLKKQGFRPFLLDWGTPGLEERSFSLEDYIQQRLELMLSQVFELAGKKVPVIGYCMGGTLCAALAVRRPEQISKLVLMAAPWHFDTTKPLAGRQNASEMLDLVECLPTEADVGVDMLQTFFTNVDPTLSDRKFRAYHDGKYDGDQADFFSAMEVWANNGPNLARTAAIDCLQKWYRDNEPYLGKWSVGGEIISPEKIKCPTLVAAPKGDRLVPQESAFAVLDGIQQGSKHEPPSGHIGMVVGNRAEAGLWCPVRTWLDQ